MIGGTRESGTGVCVTAKADDVGVESGGVGVDRKDVDARRVKGA